MNYGVVRRKIEQARTRIISSNPFFGMTLINTKVIARNSIPTAATNGKDIFYNPLFFNDINIEHIAFAIEHELYHKTLLHLFRSKDKDKKLWNIAIDLAVHSHMMLSGKYASIIMSGYYYYDKRCNGKTADEIYWMLKSNQSLLEAQMGRKGFDEHNVSDATIKSQQTDIENEIRSSFKIVNTGDKARLQSLKSEFIKCTGKKIDVESILRNFFEEAYSRHDYDYTQPERRFAGSGFCIPSIQPINEKRRINEVVAAVDTSGSVDDAEKVLFIDLISNLSEEFCDKIHLIFCDDDIQGVHEFEGKIEDLVVPKGYTTDFKPVFKYIEENGIQPKLLIYMTDLCVHEKDFPGEDPEYKVVWAKASSAFDFFQPPFGEVITIDI